MAECKKASDKRNFNTNARDKGSHWFNEYMKGFGTAKERSQKRYDRCKQECIKCGIRNLVVQR